MQLALKKSLDTGKDDFINLYQSVALAACFSNDQLALDYLRQLPPSSWQYGMSYGIDDDPFFDSLRNNQEFMSIISSARAENDKIQEEIARLEALGEL